MATGTRRRPGRRLRPLCALELRDRTARLPSTREVRMPPQVHARLKRSTRPSEGAACSWLPRLADKHALVLRLGCKFAGGPLSHRADVGKTQLRGLQASINGCWTDFVTLRRLSIIQRQSGSPFGRTQAPESRRLLILTTTPAVSLLTNWQPPRTAASKAASSPFSSTLLSHFS